jgi:hypothetical protein
LTIAASIFMCDAPQTSYIHLVSASLRHQLANWSILSLIWSHKILEEELPYQRLWATNSNFLFEKCLIAQRQYIAILIKKFLHS